MLQEVCNGGNKEMKKNVGNKETSGRKTARIFREKHQALIAKEDPTGLGKSELLLVRGARLKKAREAAGLRLIDAAKQVRALLDGMGMSGASTIGNLESGKNGTDQKTMAALAKVYKVPLAYLLAKEDNLKLSPKDARLFRAYYDAAPAVRSAINLMLGIKDGD